MKVYNLILTIGADTLTNQLGNIGVNLLLRNNLKKIINQKCLSLFYSTFSYRYFNVLGNFFMTKFLPKLYDNK